MPGGKVMSPAKGSTQWARRTGIVFPPTRIRRYLKTGRYARMVYLSAAIYLAAVLEYLVAEVVELGGNAARDNKRLRICPRHLTLAIRNDNEISALVSTAILPQGGVKPNIHPQLLKPPKIKGISKSFSVNATKQMSTPKFSTSSRARAKKDVNGEIGESVPV